MDLAYLSTLTPEQFEAERARIIANEIVQAPVEHRKGLVRLQTELDSLRRQVGPEEFMFACLHRAGENLENISDQFVAVGHLVGVQPERKHV